MGQRIVTGVPDDQVAGFCELQRAYGATVCDPTPKGNGTSDVLVVFPDTETFEDHASRTNG